MEEMMMVISASILVISYAALIFAIAVFIIRETGR